MSHPASQLWISSKDCFTILHNQRAQERHGNYINGFSKRNLSLLKSNLVILEQKWYGVFFTWICSQVFLLILLNKRDREVHENFISCFLRKNLIWGNLILSSYFLMFDWVWLKLSQVTVSFGSLQSQDMTSQVNVYVADTVLRYYMMFMYGGQYST